jgi:hypothetical protein
MVSALFLWAPLIVLAAVLEPSQVILLSSIVWPFALVLILGSIVVSIFYDGTFGIDRPLRRSMVYRTLMCLLALIYVAVAAALGVLAGQYLSTGVVALFAVCATLLFQPVWRRLER